MTTQCALQDNIIKNNNSNLNHNYSKTTTAISLGEKNPLYLLLYLNALFKMETLTFYCYVLHGIDLFSRRPRNK